MADGSFPTLISKDREANAQTNSIWVSLTNGTDDIEIGGGVEASALRVTIANDSTGVVSIDDGGGAITVDGTVAVSSVGGTVTIAGAVTNAGTFAVQEDGAALTALQLIDNIVLLEDATHGDGDPGVMTLAVRNDVLAALAGTDGDYAPLQVNADGALYVSASFIAPETDDSAFTPGTGKVMPMGALADETATDSVDEGDVGIPRMTLDRKLIIEIADATTDSQRLAINATGEVGVVQATAADLNVTEASAAAILADTTAILLDTAAIQTAVELIDNAVDGNYLNVNMNIAGVDVSASVPVPISATAAANSESNPIYVQPVTTGVSGVEVHDYDTAAAVASDATDNHDYTVTGTTFLLKSVIVSGSGNVKFEIQTGPVASLATVAVGFLTGRGGDTKQVTFDPAIEVPVTSTGTVRVIRTNRQGAATDVYSTIIGNDV